MLKIEVHFELIGCFHLLETLFAVEAGAERKASPLLYIFCPSTTLLDQMLGALLQVLLYCR